MDQYQDINMKIVEAFIAGLYIDIIYIIKNYYFINVRLDFKIS